MRAFYGSKISEHMTETPEGYLVCLGVPIGRTGEQEYLPRELGLEAQNEWLEKGKLVKVYRREQDVFKPSAVASFEGKPLCNDHPPEDVTSANYPMYTKGTVVNVRRGTLDSGEDALLCDLIVYDANLAQQIRAGKREISCGYDCTYVSNGDGTYHQEDIIGNHVAVVDKGRAGASVSIKDSIPTQKGAKRMGKTQSIWHRMFNAFVKDAEPSEVLEAMDAMKECGTAEKAEDEAPGEKVEKSDEKYAALEAKVDALAEKIDKILAAEKREPEHEDDEIGALDELVEELKEKKTEDEPDEESVTVEPEEIDEEEEVEEKDELPEEVEEKEEVKVKDSMVRFISKMKPIIASLPAGQRKKAADAMAKAYRDAAGVKGGEKVSYASFAKRKAADSKAQNFAEFGENCRKRNPHFKG